jgi:hypothetical protein
VETSARGVNALARETTTVMARRHHVAQPICRVCRGTGHTWDRWN